MTTKIRQQMLDLLDAGDRNALEIEAALNVLLLLQNHPTLLDDNHSEAPFAPIPEPAPAPEPPKEKKITLDVLRAKIVEMRDKKGLTAKDFLSAHGYAKLSDVPDTAYADLYAELEAM
jgi:hypothetical protein